MVWESLLGAEIRAPYFGELANRYQRRQERFLWANLFFSSSAFAAVFSSILVVPKELKVLLAILPPVISAWAIAAKSEQKSTNARDLHERWNVLALGYRKLWANVYSADAESRLDALKESETKLSTSSTSMPNLVSLMKRCQRNVIMHHQRELPA